MTRAALLACLALAACSRPVSCVVSTAADGPPRAGGHIVNSKGVVIRVTKAGFDGFGYRLKGVMENVSGHTLEDAKIECKFTDKDGHVIYADNDYAFNMSPGEVKNLDISMLDDGTPAGWSCAVVRVLQERTP